MLSEAANATASSPRRNLMGMIMESGACTRAASWLHSGMLRMTATAALVLLSLLAGCKADEIKGKNDPALQVGVNEGGDPAQAWVVLNPQGVPARPAAFDDWS